MKILHTEWSTGWGGQEIRTYTEIKYLKDEIEFILAVRKDSKLGEKVKELGVKVYELPFKSNFDIKTILKLKEIIKKEKVDIINTHSGKDTWIGGFAAKLSNIKFLRTRHLAYPINSSRLNFINELADFIITTGTQIKEMMIKNNRIDPKKIESIPTGVDEIIFDPYKINRTIERKKLNIKENELAIGMLGVVRSVKRHEDFIKAASVLNKRFDNLKFFIAGDGPLLEKMKSLAKKLNVEIEFLGHVENPQNYLAALDIFVNCSKSEGVPQAVIQALMMNKAVVATNVGSVKDLYKNNFLLIEPLNVNILIENIEKLILNKELRLQLNSIARKSIIDEFSIKSMKNKLLNIYDKVLQ